MSKFDVPISTVTSGRMGIYVPVRLTESADSLVPAGGSSNREMFEDVNEVLLLAALRRCHVLNGGRGHGIFTVAFDDKVVKFEYSTDLTDRTGSAIVIDTPRNP